MQKLLSRCTTGLVTVLLASVTNAGLVQACTQPQGDSGHWFSGGVQTTASSPWSAQSTFDTYNPSPAYISSSLWIMLADQPGCHYSQVGWTKDNHLSNSELFFIEWTPDDCNAATEFHHDWGTPSGLNVYYVGMTQLSPRTFQFSWQPSGCPPCKTSVDSSSYANGSVNWTPTQIQNFGEVQTYHKYSTYSAGDHAAGDKTAVVNIYNTQWSDNNYISHNANLTYQFSGQGGGNGSGSTDYQAGDHASGNQWWSWDARCG